MFDEEGGVDFDAVFEQMDPQAREAIIQLRKDIEADPTLLDQERLQDHIMEQYIGSEETGTRVEEVSTPAFGKQELSTYTFASLRTSHVYKATGLTFPAKDPTILRDQGELVYQYVQLSAPPCAAEVAAATAAFLLAERTCKTPLVVTPAGALRCVAATGVYLLASAVASSCIGELV